MKGRKRVYEQRLQKNITIESWMAGILDDSKKFGMLPTDFIQMGMISMFKAENKLPLSMVRAFIEYIKPHVIEMNEILQHYEDLEKQLSNLPEPTGDHDSIPAPKQSHWSDDFHAVKLITDNKIFLLLKTEYAKDPALFEMMDEDQSISWVNLEKYYSLDAVIKVHNSQPEKKDVTA
jgi:hypothetical protein